MGHKCKKKSELFAKEYIRNVMKNRNSLHQRVALLRSLIQRAGTDGLYILIALLALVVALWGFIELADDVLEGDTQRIDEMILHVFRQQGDLASPIGPQWLPQVMRDITALGGHAVLTLVTLIAAGYCVVIRRFGMVLLILAASLGGMALSAVMKELFGRARPDTLLHLAEVSTASFPSGHSMLSAAIYLSLSAIIAEIVPGHKTRAYILGTAFLLTGLVGVSRIFLGVHYPTDVLAGWAVGIAWAIICWLMAIYMQRYSKSG